MRVGFDLGTTYCAFCIYDETDKSTDYLKFDTCARDFFPTIIAYHKEDDVRRYIGEAARRYRFSPKYDVYDTFKLSLGDSAFDARGREKTPFQVAQDFVDQVLKKCAENRGVRPEEIVLVQTVPDIWKNELNNKIALEHLAKLYDGLGLDTDGHISFESEPVSAAAFYLNEICRGAYTGSIVVIDYGGGTLDLTLCRAEKNGSISVLDSCGNGGNGVSGCAGNAFDRAATLRLIERNGLDAALYAAGTPAFGALQSAFEDGKIASAQSIRTAMERYYGSGGLDDAVAFSILLPPPTYAEYDVYASDIAGAFEQVNESALRDSVLEMQRKCREMEIDTGDIEHFRVLLVGGFSNLYCVENCVRELFGAVTGIDDPRFDARMNRESRSTAIAHGACLIAAGITPVVYINQTEMGFCARNLQGESIAVPVLERGKPVREYAQPRFSPYTLVRAFQEMPVRLTLYFDDGFGPVKIRMDEQFSALCPNYEQRDNKYQIGFSIDRHRIPHLHVRDANGAENVVSLYQVIAQLPALTIDDEKGEEHP